ncbi:type I-E CRISPR-associated protein Cse1/CasA [Saccharothrix violaceirubra]|uniref:CRISPR system Cascade subunit CasA n=1 Tax=Saccharothrix violaceirubra TaxID=413306 RepID=A0A7W7WWF1_9PSEU|nr:type I-E CRISPR-associated protein Cse1/CasA [Saccharothrix violaceirubra]MBB4966290.1 CRISPR system Cascade subunit CasA [Saccharothrix violaceirubra]
MTDRVSFDLLTEPWIPVLDLDGDTREVGLVELVLESHRLLRIVGETPPMTAALYRVVLAFLHRACAVADESAWRGLWEADSFHSDPLADYLAKFGDRFDLFDPHRPFLQCPALARIAPATPAKLIPHRAVGNNVTLFDHTTADDVTVFDPAQAARLLVTTQAFDPGGTKTPYQQVKASTQAPGNLLGVVLVEGRTLRETLLFNALLYDPELELPRKTTVEDAPAWEADDPPVPVPQDRPARGWTDLLTWPSRRVLLSHEPGGHRVDGVVITPGVKFTGDLPQHEKMAAFRVSTDLKGKPKKDAPLLPVKLVPQRGVWRHSVELLLADRPGEGRSRLRPPALDQIAGLAARGHLSDAAVYTLRVFGQKLDDNASVVETYLEEAVAAPVALLRAEEPYLAAMVGTAIALADAAGSAVRRLVDGYREERVGKDRKRPKAPPGLDLSYWPNLTRAFDDLLIAVGAAHREHRSEREALSEWADHVAATAREAADRWAESAASDGAEVVVVGKHVEKFHDAVDVLVRTFKAEVRRYLTREQDE